MDAAPPERYRFGPFELEPDKRRLLKDGATISLRPRAFDLLAAQVEELVTANRLVTLTGAGGAGKTRLAIEVASRLIDGFPDGVWLVELAALSDPRLVPQGVAQVLALTDQPARPVIETLNDYLA